LSTQLDQEFRVEQVESKLRSSGTAGVRSSSFAPQKDVVERS
jgi:hypothetical protein